MKNEIVGIFEKQIQAYIKKKRPPVDIRDQLDIGYTFKNNKLEIFEIRPQWKNKEEKIHIPVAKAWYIESRNIWKLYWMRASGKWEPYKPDENWTLKEVLEEIEKDGFGCFWG